MKINIYGIFTLMLLLFACDQQLDIEPQQAISSDLALSTEQGVRTALLGAYSLLRADVQEGADPILHSDLIGDDGSLVWTGFLAPINQILNKNIAVENRSVSGFWASMYRIIQQVNAVLDAIDVVNENDRLTIEAEARFLRGMVYFDLIDLFAQAWVAGDPELNPGVPIVQLPVEQLLSNPSVPRNTVSEVYLFIMADLLFAKVHLPEQNGVLTNSYAASALLSRLYLAQEQFDLAAEESERVISSGLYELLPELEQVYNQSQNTPEDIFAIQVTGQAGGAVNSLGFFYSGELEGGAGFLGITDQHMGQYEPSDKRAELFYFDLQNGVRRTGKWLVNTLGDGNIPILRLAEMYLTLAECQFRTGDMDSATDNLNVVRNRAGLPSLDPSEIDLETILKERFTELAFEGHWNRDRKRNRKNIGELSFDSDRLVYPIPQREMDVNSELVQNPGY